MLSASSTQEWRAVGRECIALIFMRQGKFAKAIETIDAAISADRMEQAGRARYPEKFFQKSRIYMEKNDYDRALKEYEAGMRIVNERDPDNVIGSRDLYVYMLLKAGREEDALKVYEALDKDLAEKGGIYVAARQMTRAIKQYGEGNPEAAAESAVQAFEVIHDARSYADFGSRFFLAKTMLDAGRLSEAVRELESVLSMYDEKRAMLPIWSVVSHFHLGKAYEMSGWNDKAIEQYQTFLDIWREADPDIPSLEEARERLANLKRAS